jgi:hypothetical protein
MQSSAMENPYAPPLSNVSQISSGVLSTDGVALVIPQDFRFPAICIKTGATENLAPIRTSRLIWRHPAVRVVHLLVPLLYLLEVPYFQREGIFDFHVTEKIALECKRSLQRINRLFYGGITCIASVFIVQNMDYTEFAAIAGTVLLMSSIICRLIAGRFLSAQKITKTHVHLLGIPSDVQRQIMELCREPADTNAHS